MAEKVPGWLERLLLPKLSTIEGELKSINTRIDSLGDKIESAEDKLNTRIDSVEDKIDSLRNELKADITRVDQKIDSLSEKMELARDVEKLKVEVAELRRQKQ